jgi:hypothetical protein
MRGHEVEAPREVAGMQTIPKAGGVHRATDAHLRLGVLAADGRC